MRCVALGLALVLAAGRADAKPDRIAEAFDTAAKLYKQTRYLDAIHVLDPAFAEAPHETSIIWLLALSNIKAYDADPDPTNPDTLVRAVELFHLYLAEFKPAPELFDHRADAEEQLRRLEPRLDKIKANAALRNEQVRAPAPAPPRTILVIGSPVASATIAFDGVALTDNPGVRETTAGTHHVVVTAPGYKPAERDAVAVTGQTNTVDVVLEELPASLFVHGTTGARVAIDGELKGTIGDALTVAPGRHRVTVIERGHDAWAHDVDFEHGGTREITAELAVSRQRVLSRYVLAGAGALVVAGSVATIIAYRAQGQAKDYNAIVAGGGSLTDDERVHYNGAIDRRDRSRTTAIVLFSTAAAAAATGALLYFVDTPRVEPGAPPPLLPAVGPGTVGATVQGRF